MSQKKSTFCENVTLASEDLVLSMFLVMSICLTGPFLFIRWSSVTTLAANLEKWQQFPQQVLTMFPHLKSVCPSYTVSQLHLCKKYVWSFFVKKCLIECCAMDKSIRFVLSTCCRHRKILTLMVHFLLG